MDCGIVTDATKAYETGKVKHTVFSGFSLTVEEGTSTFVLGPNGCGKSTLLRVLIGLEELDRGAVDLRLEGRDLCGAVTQDYRSQLVPWATITDNLLIAHRSNDADAEFFVNRCFEYLASWRYGLERDARVLGLSGGQQQAIVLARALAHEPKMMVWDEPFSAVDFARRQLMYKTVSDYCAQRRRTALVTTHDLDQALQLADRVLVYDTGMAATVDLRVDVARDIRLVDPRGSSELKRLRETILNAILEQSP